MSPEMLQGKGYGQATDFWSFGCIVYEMLVGLPPFMHKNSVNLYKLIKYTPPTLNYPFISDAARDLCTRLLDKDPYKRLGSFGRGVQEIMEHPWFE